MICCSCGKEIDINYGREYWNGIYCKKCADEMLSTPEYIKNYKRIIADLQAENAALRERLEKPVELKVKVGDKIYCIHRTSDPIIIEWQVDEIRITDHNCILHLVIAGTKNYRNESSQCYGKWWFTTREAAEARLAELKGEKK